MVHPQRVLVSSGLSSSVRYVTYNALQGWSVCGFLDGVSRQQRYYLGVVVKHVAAKTAGMCDCSLVRLSSIARKPIATLLYSC